MILAFSLPGRLESPRSKVYAVRDKIHLQSRIEQQQNRWMLMLMRAGKDGELGTFLRESQRDKRRVIVRVTVCRLVPILDADNLAWAFNKAIVDGWVRKGWLTSDADSVIQVFLTQERVKAKDYETVKISIEQELLKT